MKVGLFITTLLHDITQAGYGVKFNKDLRGMVRIDFRKERDPEFYEHEHCGLSGGTRNQLEREIIGALHGFMTRHSLPSVTEHEDEDTRSGPEPEDGSEPDDADQRDEELGNTGALG